MLYGLALGAAFLLPLLVLGPFDDEDVQLGVFSSQLHYRDLLHGRWSFWLPGMGFGTPMPMGHRMDFHPVWFLASFVPLRVTLSVLWLGHLGIMVVYFLRLAAASGIRQPVRAIVLACYVFSAVSVCLFYENDWTTSVIGWSLFPAVVFYLRQAVLEPPVAGHGWLAAVRLGVVVGLWGLNSHPGYIAPLAIVLVVYGVMLTGFRLRGYIPLVSAAMCAAGMCAERLYFIVTEMQRFPLDLPRTLRDGYAVADYLSAALAPLTPVDPEMRLPFLGVVVGLAALASTWRVWGSTDAHLRACAVAFAASFVLSILPADWLWSGISAGWLFRDSLVFFGLLAGGRVLSDLAGGSRRRWALTSALLAVQLLQQSGTVAPGFREFFDRNGPLLFYRYQGTATGLAAALVADARQYGPRIYLSARVQELARGALSPYGIHVLTDLTLLGLSPVNGWFKGVSMDALQPSRTMMHGYIGGENDVISNAPLLDVLGVNLVLTTEREGPPPAGLLERSRVSVATFLGEETIVVLANPDAWPRAVLMDAGAPGVSLPRRPSCDHARALCRDFSGLVERRLAGVVAAEPTGDGETLRFPPAESPRMLFLSTMYRPEWHTTSSHGSLPFSSIAGAFIGIEVPAGVDEVQLAFLPRARIWLSGFSGLVTVLLCVVAAVAPLRRMGDPRRR